MRNVFTALQMIHCRDIYHLEVSLDNLLVLLEPGQGQKVAGEKRSSIKLQSGAPLLPGANEQDVNQNDLLRLTNFLMTAGFDKRKFSHNKLSALSFMSGQRLMAEFEIENPSEGQVGKCDVWSAGIILYILMTGEAPFKGKDVKHLVKSIRSCKYSADFEYSSSDAFVFDSLVRRLIVKDIDDRLDAVSALNHEAVTMELREPDATVSAAVHLRMKKTIVEMLFKDELKNYYTFQTFLYTVENCLEAIFTDPKKEYTLADVTHGLSHLTEDMTIAQFVLKAFDPSRLRKNPDKTPVQVIYDYYLQFYHSKFVS